MTAEATTPDVTGPAYADPSQRRWVKWHLYLSFVGFAVGILMGILQALDRLGIFLYDDVGLQSYYQGLTLHGVGMALVFTFAFASSFLTITTTKGFNRPMASTRLVQASFWAALAGVGLAVVAMLWDEASVLFTFYSPLEAHTAFYLGAVLLVISTWITFGNQVWTLIEWRRDNPGERIPIMSFVSLITFLMWVLSSIGIAVEVVVFILPWSMGIIDGTDPLLNRTLFWFTGHPIVYFWLLPAYVSWYMCIPKQVGGKLFSDGVVRVVFIMFLLLSIPVGLHHQFTDPGVDEGLKFIHTIFTFGVFFPSMVTAFTIIAALEDGGRRAGGKGLLRWIGKLPWGDPSVSAQLLAMIAFALGGISGIVNASNTVNLVVHNTAFIVGHFHLTVGTAVALSIMGISYWLVPYLTGKRLFSRRTALVQAWTWFLGVLVFSRGQIAGGLEGMPRRMPAELARETYAAGVTEWELPNLLTGLGGTLMFVSGVLFFVVIIGTLVANKPLAPGEVEIPVAETMHGPESTPRLFDRILLWTVITVLLIALAYVPVFLTLGADLGSTGYPALTGG